MKPNLVGRQFCSSWLVAALCVGGCGCVLADEPEFQPQSVTLQDGTVLTLEAVTYGQWHTRDKGDPALSGPETLTYSTTTESLCFWVRQQFPSPTNGLDNRFSLVDDQEQLLSGWAAYTEPAVSPTNRLQGYIWTSWPRRGEWLRLRFYSGGERIQRNPPRWGPPTLRAEFRVRNPARGPFADWPTETLPARRMDGDLEITLTRLLVGARFDGAEWRSATNLSGVAVAQFRVARGGVLVTNWIPTDVDYWDTTGNHMAGGGIARWHDGEVSLASFSLGPDPAWKLRVEFRCEGGFAPEELWTARGLQTTNLAPHKKWPADQWPDPNQAVVRTRFFGTVIEAFPLFEDPDLPSHMDLEFHTTPHPAGWLLVLVEVTDQQGRLLLNWEKRRSGWSRNGYFRYAIKRAPDVTSINATVALYRRRYVEFIAKPVNLRDPANSVGKPASPGPQPSGPKKL